MLVSKKPTKLGVLLSSITRNFNLPNIILETTKAFLNLMFNKNYRVRSKKKLILNIGRGIMSWINTHLLLMLRLTKFKKVRNYYRNLTIKKGGFNKLIIKSFIWMDPFFIIDFLTRGLSKVHFGSHRIMIKRVINYTSFFAKKRKILAGFFYYISGKLSVGGNSRTRTLKITWGYWAVSKSWLRARLKFGIVYTITGCLGTSLFYSF